MKIREQMTTTICQGRSCSADGDEHAFGERRNLYKPLKSVFSSSFHHHQLHHTFTTQYTRLSTHQTPTTNNLTPKSSKCNSSSHSLLSSLLASSLCPTPSKLAMPRLDSSKRASIAAKSYLPATAAT